MDTVASPNKDGYRYINIMGNWLLQANCGMLIRQTEKYKKLKDYIVRVLSDYPDNRVREKYLWLQTELECVADMAENARRKEIENV